MDANTASTLGKLREVWGLTDNNHHTSIAEAKEISSQMPFGILDIKLLLFFLGFDALSFILTFLSVRRWLLSIASCPD